MKLDTLLGELDIPTDKDASLADLTERLGALQARHHNVCFDHDRMQDRLQAEIERLRAEVDALRGVLGRILENEASDWKAAEEFGGYVLDDELREEARAALEQEKER